MYLTWAYFNNVRMLLMACMPIVIFYLIWLVNTSEAIRSEEGTLLDLICWPDGNAIPVIIACGSIIAVVIEIFGLYQLFKSGLPKREYNVTNGLFYYIWALIVMIIIFLAIMFYSGLQSTIIRAKIKGGITKAMLRYASHLPSKVAIDRLQTRFRCCGRVDYQEWFYIPWFTTNENIAANAISNSKFVADNVPYSCCSKDVLSPCIHHGITRMGVIYKYDPSDDRRAIRFTWTHTTSEELRVSLGNWREQIIGWDTKGNIKDSEGKVLGKEEGGDGYPATLRAMHTLFYIGFLTRAVVLLWASVAVYKQLTIWSEGCEEKLINEMMSVSWRFNAVMSLIIITMILQVMAVRYLHTAYKNGLHCGNQITCNAYLLRSATDTKVQQTTPSKRKAFRRKKKRQTRTLQWVTGSSPSALKRYDSSTDVNTSDELLKPIFE